MTGFQATAGSQTSREAAVQEAIQAAREAAREAARDAAQQARDAAQQARDAALAAQGADAVDVPEPPQPPAPPGTIVIPNGGGGDLRINVDGSGIHVSQNGTSTVIPIHDVVPQGAVQITWAVFGSLAFMVVGWPLARAFARRMDRRAVTTQLSAEVQARLDAMERNIDTVAIELERVSEGQRFTNRLLEQRPLEHAQRSDR